MRMNLVLWMLMYNCTTQAWRSNESSSVNRRSYRCYFFKGSEDATLENEPPIAKAEPLTSRCVNPSSYESLRWIIYCHKPQQSAKHDSLDWFKIAFCQATAENAARLYCSPCLGPPPYVTSHSLVGPSGRPGIG